MTDKQWSVATFPWLASSPCLDCDDPCVHETWVTAATIQGPRRWPDPEDAPWYVEDAEYAVRAVNAHDALVAALTTLLDLYDGTEATYEDAYERLYKSRKTWQQARTALKLATEP